ncbi:Putative thiamine biosynthesis protein [Aquimixticola soesokkakensis]|uniref:Putative thiamine biosynthesis protein n=1 Tax=Aquimixticola soesokkakensis TaxID=1519096 RepID=A0A1Y5RL63_9RHOB|nr:ABC transporter substrate-binding protein [Aquimixticola soesokkakensis]SLN20069.1 Putative thiamine biosynthesis protein [Aquimixticola soesokkakensis]
MRLKIAPTKIARTTAALTFALGALPAASFAQDHVTYQLDWLPGGDKAPIYVCVQQGFCADEGLDISIEGGRGSTEAITKIATGTSDIGSAGMEAIMAAVATDDVPVKAVMSIFNKGPHAFYTLMDSGITSISDLAGKKVATSPFTSSNIFLPLVLSENGLSEADIELTKADPGALGPLLMTGQTDAIIAWVTDITRYMNQGEDAGKGVIVLPWSDAGIELYSATLVASDTFLTERPDVAKRFVKAFKKSMEFAQANPDQAAADVAAMVPELGVEDVKGSWLDASVLAFNSQTDEDGLGALLPARVANTWSLVAQAQGLDESALDPASIIADGFQE